jgi:uncharacterized RDD family membrane protein YckC
MQDVESSSIFEEEVDYEDFSASSGLRFANYIIDYIIFGGLFFIFTMPGGILLSDSFFYVEDEQSASLFNIGMRVAAIISYGIYMGLLEGVLQGKTVGKFITGTRAINIDGSKISFGKAMARGFSRAVPFCVFSASGNPPNPWQDRWTNTIVIEEKKLKKHNEQFSNYNK